MPAVPERIGKYTISEVLGQGAMGVVYKGFDPHIQRMVAIKTIHKSLIGDPETDAEQDSIAARFRNEAQAVGRIAHPGVVAIYEFGEDEKTAYIAMEFVQGHNLDQVLAGTPLLAEAQLLRIMDQLLDALHHAHAQGVWHRDIKPANLLLTAGGQVKLTDFGIARIANMGLTQVSSAIGTPGYMAPEQYIGEGIDHRADIFACGVLLYKLLTGKAPFAGSSEQAMYKILNENPVPPSKVSNGARPAAYDAVVARATAKKAEDRYPSTQAMREALLQIAQGVTVAPADSDATVILGAAKRVTTPHTPTGSPVPASQAGTALAHWDAQTLSRIERTLATHVGPMAKLMVREAARGCADVSALAASVSQHISDPAKRAQFISVVTGGSGTAAAPSGATRLMTMLSGGTPAPAPAVVPAGTRVGVNEDYAAKALQALTRVLGPIAKVVHKRAREQSGGDPARFVQALLDAVPAADRAGLERELNSL